MFHHYHEHTHTVVYFDSIPHTPSCWPRYSLQHQIWINLLLKVVPNKCALKKMKLCICELFLKIYIFSRNQWTLSWEPQSFQIPPLTPVLPSPHSPQLDFPSPHHQLIPSLTPQYVYQPSLTCSPPDCLVCSAWLSRFLFSCSAWPACVWSRLPDSCVLQNAPCRICLPDWLISWYLTFACLTK